MSGDEQGVSRAFSRIPAGLFVLTAEHEERRMGVVVTLVQRVCVRPPMVCVAVPKGDPIMPLISESRQFGLCQVAEDDKVLPRKFAHHPATQGEDPFLGLEMRGGRLARVPLLGSALSYMACELVRHMDVEGDHDLFIGHVREAGGRNGRPRLQPLGEPESQTPPRPAPPPAPDVPP